MINFTKQISDATIHIHGIPVQYYDADSHDFFYLFAIRRGFLQRLRGTGPEAVVESRVSATEHNGLIRLFSKRKKLNPFEVTGVGEDLPGKVAEIPTETACAVEGKIERKSIYFPEQLAAAIVSRYPSVESALEKEGKALLTFSAQEKMDFNLTTALNSRYVWNAKGGGPLACRIVCGTKDCSAYRWSTETTFSAQVAACIPVNAAPVAGGITDTIRQNYGMSVAHIRKLRQYAYFNPYGAEDIAEVSLLDRRLVESPKYYLIMDSNAGFSLKQDPDYKAFHYTIGRGLGDGHASALHNAEYLGCIDDVECFIVKNLDDLRKYKKRCRGMDIAPGNAALSWSFLLGAGALGEILGGTKDWYKPDECQNVYAGKQYIHGAGALCFSFLNGKSNTYLNEVITTADGNEEAASFFYRINKGENEAYKDFADKQNIENGIIHSITLNAPSNNWAN